MPENTLRLHPGVNSYETQALNEASVSTCNLIRFAPDPGGLGLIQKLGGWDRFYSSAMPSIVRALWAWGHTDTHKLLAIGCETTGGAAYLELVHDIDGARTLEDITPKVRQDNVAVSATTVLGSNQVTLDDAGSNANAYTAVYIPAHISVGGVIVFGFYQVIPVGANSFAVALIDSQGNPIYPTAAIVAGGAVATFTTAVGSAVVLVTLANHGFQVGDVYPVLISTAVGGITLVDEYVVTTVPSANTFTFVAQNAAGAVATVAINGGLARYNFYLGFSPPGVGVGYGVGGYGVGGYGTGVAAPSGTGTNIATTDWTLDNWGDILIACPTAVTFGSPTGEPVGGPLYYWSHQTNNPTALPISQGPVSNAGFFVAMPQRQIVAYGCEETGVQDPLLVRWCDVNNFFLWNATPTNLAGRYRLTRGSRIIGGLQAGHQGLLWTDVGLWTMQFIGSGGGSTLVYGFDEIAKGCGLIAQKAAGLLASQTYWMGQTQFFTLSGGGAQPLPCPVWDRIFQNLDLTNVRKIRCAPNSNFAEIAWYYPSKNGGGEVDSYVKYNSLLGTGQGWDYGSLSRTAWIDQSVFGPPIGADGPTKLIYQHETSNDADGQALQAVFQTGFFVLNDAYFLSFVDRFIPDMRWGLEDGSSTNATVLLTFYVKQYPADTAKVYGPFTLTYAKKYVTPRFRGNLVAIQFENVDVGTFWRLGACRYRWAQDGQFL